MHAPSRRQSLLILGSLGLAAAAGGAYMLENHGGGSSTPTAFGQGQPRRHGQGAQDDVNEGLEGQTNNATGENVPTLALALADDGAWRPDAAGYQAVDDVGHQIKGFASATSINVGESLDFHVSVRPAQGFTVKVFRIGRSSRRQGLRAGLHQPLDQRDGAGRSRRSSSPPGPWWRRGSCRTR